MRSFDHQGMPWIQLPLSAAPPRQSAPLPEEERRILDRRLAECRRLNDVLPVRAHRREDKPEEITAQAVRQGWRRFFLSHFGFFFTFTMLAECYERAVEHLTGTGTIHVELLERACILWRGSGALMVYGIDFHPTEEIYCEHIRPFMADGLSGTWMREYQRVNQGRKAWRAAVGKGGATNPELQEIGARLSEAERFYHRYHVQVMQTCVPDMISKLQDYEVAHGPVETSEAHRLAFDRWFHVARSEEIDLQGYLRTACAVFSELLRDITSMTSLPKETLLHLSQGVAMTLQILAESLRKDARGLDEAWEEDSDEAVS